MGPCESELERVCVGVNELLGDPETLMVAVPLPVLLSLAVALVLELSVRDAVGVTVGLCVCDQLWLWVALGCCGTRVTPRYAFVKGAAAMRAAGRRGVADIRQMPFPGSAPATQYSTYAAPSCSTWATMSLHVDADQMRSALENAAYAGISTFHARRQMPRVEAPPLSHTHSIGIVTARLPVPTA